MGGGGGENSEVCIFVFLLEKVSADTTCTCGC